jgi:hypothetical protein
MRLLTMHSGWTYCYDVPYSLQGQIRGTGFNFQTESTLETVGVQFRVELAHSTLGDGLSPRLETLLMR